MHGQWVGSHHLGQWGDIGVQPFGENPKECVALGEDTHQATVFHHQQGTDPGLFHHPGGFADGGFGPVSYTHLDVYKRQAISNAFS